MKNQDIKSLELLKSLQQFQSQLVVDFDKVRKDNRQFLI